MSKARLAIVLGWYRLVVAALAVMLGTIIIYRAVQARAAMQFYVLGLAFVGLGVYRWRLFWQLRRQPGHREEPDHA